MSRKIDEEVGSEVVCVDRNYFLNSWTENGREMMGSALFALSLSSKGGGGRWRWSRGMI